MAQLEMVKGVMLQMQREDDTFLTWGAPGCAVLPDGTFFVIAHTEFESSYTSSNPAQGTGFEYVGGVQITVPAYYGYQIWRLDSDLNVLHYELVDDLAGWSPLYVVPLEDYVVQVVFTSDPQRVRLFDCRDGGARLMADHVNTGSGVTGAGIYSYLYTTHLYLREFGLAVVCFQDAISLYRRGELLSSTDIPSLGYPYSFFSILGAGRHPTDPLKFALVDWYSQNTLRAYEFTIDPATWSVVSGELLWERAWATEVTDWVLSVGDPYADTVWGWVSDEVGTDVTYYLRSMDGGVGTEIWHRPNDYTANNQNTRAIAPNVVVAVVEKYDGSASGYAPGVPNYSEEEYIAVCVLDLGHGEPSAKMIGLSRRDLVLGAGVPFTGYEDVDDVRNGSQYAPAYRDGTLLLASCPVYGGAADNIDRFPVLVWKLTGAAHSEFSVKDGDDQWLSVTDGLGPGRLKLYTADGWQESVTADTWDQEWKPLKINVAEDGDPVWRTVALLTPSPS